MCLAQKLERHAVFPKGNANVVNQLLLIVPLTKDLAQFIAKLSVKEVSYGGRACASLATFLIEIGKKRGSSGHLARHFNHRILTSLQGQMAEMHNLNAQSRMATSVIHLLDVSPSFAESV